MISKATVTTSHRWLQLPDRTVAVYNYWDCLATARAKPAVQARLKQNGQLAYFEREIWSLVPAVLAMQRMGLPYDSKLKGQYRKRLRRELRDTDDQLRKLYASTANYEYELNLKRLTEHLVANPPDGPEGRKYRARQTKGITLTKAETNKLNRRLPEGWNPNSDDQVARWLFEDLGLRPSTKTKGGKSSTDMDALSRIYRNLRKMDEHARPALQGLMHRARLQKIDNDYLDPEVRYDLYREGSSVRKHHQDGSRGEGNTYDNGETLSLCSPGPREGCQGEGRDTRDNHSRTGRVYPTIKMTGTESGRFSYADPPVHSWPDEIRHLVRPGTGSDWLGADYSQVEARIFAILTNDERDLEIYRRFDENPEDKEWDIHIRTAADLFGLSVCELLSKPTEQLKGMRIYSKNFRYGVLLYGGGPTSTKAKVGCPCPKCITKAPPTVDVTPKERKTHAERWFNQHRCAIRWREGISAQVREHHQLQGPLGQVWFFMAPWSTDTQREAWNRIIQGTAAGIIHRSMRHLHALQCPLRLQHHDALYAETPTSGTNHWARTMRDVMEKPIPELDNHRFPVEVEVGPSWGEMSEWHHKNGE